MLREKNYEQHIENINYIETSELRDIYCYMVGRAACLIDYECFPNKPAQAGNKRDFQFHTGANQPFAFIINRNSILFYFRRPARNFIETARIQNAFPDANWKDNGETTVRIDSLTRAKEVLDFVFGAH